MAEALTRQDLIYAAYALRVAASDSEKRAGDPVFHSSQQIFEGSAKRYRELAAKCDRIAERTPK